MTKISPSVTASSQVNQIINGGFRIWQRGTSFTGIGINQYGPDKWQVDQTATGNINQSTDSKYGQYAMLIEDTDSGEVFEVANRVDDGVESLIGQTVTASAWVKEGPTSPAPGASLNLAARDAVDNALASDGDDVTSIGSYTRVTTQITVPQGTEWIEVAIQPSPDFTESDTGEVLADGVTLVIGDEPADYPQVVRPVGQEEMLAQRYYERFDWQTWYTPVRAGDGFQIHSKFSTSKAAVPTISTSLAAVSINSHDSSSSITGDAPNWSESFNTIDTELFRQDFQRSSFTSLAVVSSSGLFEFEVT